MNNMDINISYHHFKLHFPLSYDSLQVFVLGLASFCTISLAFMKHRISSELRPLIYPQTGCFLATHDFGSSP